MVVVLKIMASVRLVLLMFFCCLRIASANSGIYGDECPVALSHNTSKACQVRRYQLLQAQQRLYQLAPVPNLEKEPIRWLNMSIEQQKAVFQRHPFESWEFNIYLTKNRAASDIFRQWQSLNAGQDVQSFSDFVKIYAFFRQAQMALGSPFFMIPSNVEPFKDLVTYWLQDKVFAEQRLAGVNPVTLMRVTSDRDTVGIKWTELNKVLNQDFDWDNLIMNTPDMPKFSLQKAISQRMVFVLRYPLLDNIPTMPDIAESRPNRELWNAMSPIALFAVHPWKRDKLVPVAIQMDVKSGSPVYTPKDGSLWILAKLNVQGADLGYNQIAEHLPKTHLLMEPFCVSKDRQLSEWHPLHQIIKFHCRGISITDKLAFAILLSENGRIHTLFPYGYQGAVSIGLRSYRQTTWKDTDFIQNIKKRGVERRSLHYFPYRDDGYLLYHAIQRAVKDYVAEYYDCDEDVKNDFELQNFMNEVSADGKGSGGALGNIKGLPRELTSVNSLLNFLTRFIWQISVHHAAINYPMTDYGGFTLNSPTKLYRDSRVSDDVFSLFRYPNANISAEQGLVAMSLSDFRFDSLFDYGDQLPDERGRAVITKWFYYLRRKVQPSIESRNRKRLKDDHLTYPYLSPRWIPNGIQT